MPAKSGRKTNWALWGTVLVLFAAACTMVSWSSPSTPSPSSQARSTPPGSQGTVTQVTVTSGLGSATTTAATLPIAFEQTNMTLKGLPFKMEVATTHDQQERGLMYRKSMLEDAGMLFVMDKEDTWNFWMENTWIPLDIIFLDAKGKVLDVQARQPMDKTGMGPKTPALYIIELNVGRADKIGLKPGDIVEIPKKYVKN